MVQKTSILYQRGGCAKGERGQGKGFPKGKALSRKGKRESPIKMELIVTFYAVIKQNHKGLVKTLANNPLVILMKRMAACLKWSHKLLGVLSN
ncbi:hypothetical protein BCT81_02545 [Vibrio sp. 10N.261.52.A1]|nr:hypothetical protein BCT81_02545 [Vibrio sp. 10N.261.52.A1]